MSDPSPSVERLAPLEDPDAFLAWVEELGGLPAGERDRALADLRSRSEAEATPYMDALERLVGAEAPAAAWFVDQMARTGIPEEEAVALLAQAADHVGLQAAWTDWEDVEDRSEVRLRLQVLARTPSLHEDLAPFVAFFFRASDPELFRLAALAMGRHLHASDHLASYLEGWSSERGLDPAQPATLDGTRSPRRLLFVQAGAASRATTGAPPDAGHGDESPELAVGDPRRTLETIAETTADQRDVQDLSVALRAAVPLLETDASLAPTCLELLELPDEGGAGPPVRLQLEAWGRLLPATLSTVTKRDRPEDVARLEQAWRRRVDHQLASLRAREAVGERVALLQGLDELIRALVRAPDASEDRLLDALLRDVSTLEAALVAQRMGAWRIRHGEHRPVEVPEGVGLTTGDAEQLPPVVRSVLEHTWELPSQGGDLLADERTESTVDLADALLASLATKQAWQEESRRARAIALFQLLDLFRYEVLPPERLEALLQKHGLPGGRGWRATGDRAERRSAAARVMVRVISWEGEAADALLDARAIHEIDDVQLLVGIVRTGRETATLPALVDAIEHRFRWQLRRDASFSPVGFLARLTVREPAPELYETLALVSQGRAYRTASHEGSFPLSEVAEQLADQAHATRGPTAPGELAEHWDPAPLSSWDPFAGALSRVRARLAGDASEDPGNAIQTLAELVGRRDPRGAPAEDTVLSLLWRLNDADRPMVRTGDPPWTTGTTREIVDQASAEVERLAGLADVIERQAPGGETRGGFEQAQAALWRLTALLTEGLPLAETRLLRRRVEHIDALLSSWSAALAALEELHEDGWPEDPDRWALLVEEATHRGDEPPRLGLVPRLWTGLWLGATTDADPALEGEDVWERRAALLRWGLAHPDETSWPDPIRTAWLEEVAASYEALLVDALDANREDRVIELIKHPAYERARTAPTLRDTMPKARRWCLDRYRPGAALAARRATDPEGSPTGLIQEGVSFLVHFSPVWSALLVGAIFLLDFGDAWVELAQARDVRGIVLTCVIGVLGAYTYVVRDLRSKVQPPPTSTELRNKGRLHARAAAFTGVCVLVAVVITTFLWWMLGATDVVVRGPWAVANIAVWSGFALFVGIVFGLVIQKGL